MQNPYCHSETFTGVYFILFGFDSITENNVRTKLVSGGGVDVGKYSRNCTHVIVDKLVYDHDVCAAAREDGKKVVTALWVDHSFDVEMQLDPNSIIYRPPRDLNGIPGANTLVFCLTGYQRQDREDIMTMVGLMGAQFTKPLVANKVTHLVCYKFEGEKYELAKKMRKIKLINHRWLEDSLRDWTLLPEENYSKSAYELETMEAEAKDSEDEVERPSVQSSGGRISTTNPSNFNTDNVKKDTAAVHTVVEMAKTPEPRHEILNKFGCEDLCVSGAAASGNLSGTLLVTTGSGMKGNSATATSGCAGERNNLDSKFSSMSYSRKTSSRCTLPRFSEESTGKETDPSKIPSSKTCNDNIETVCQTLEIVQCQKESHCVDGFGKVADGIFEETTGALPQQKSGEVSCANFKPEKPSPNEQSSGKIPISYVKTPVSTSRRADTKRRLSVGNSCSTLDEKAQLSFAKGSGTLFATTGRALSPSKSKILLSPSAVTSEALGVGKQAERPESVLNEKNSEVSPTSNGKTKGLLQTSYRAMTNRINSEFSLGETSKIVIAKDSSTMAAPKATTHLALKAQERLVSNDVTSETMQCDKALTTHRPSLKMQCVSDIDGERKIADIGTHQIDTRPDPGNWNKDAQCLSNEMPDLNGFSELASNLCTERNGKAVAKRTGKKSVTKKTLGSRRKFSAEGNQKSSVYLHKITSVDAAAASHLDKCEVPPDIDKHLSSPQRNDFELAPRSFNENGENEKASETVDDETEGPEGRVEFELDKEDVKKTEVVPLSKTSDPVAGDGKLFCDVNKSVKSIHEEEDKNGTDVAMSDVVVHSINDHDEPLVFEEAMPVAEQPETICGTYREQLDSCTGEASASKKGNKGRKRPLAKTKTKTTQISTGSLKSKETPENEDSNGCKKDKSEVETSNPEGKCDSHAMPMNNLENCSELEKENMPVIDRNQTKRQKRSKTKTKTTQIATGSLKSEGTTEKEDSNGGQKDKSEVKIWNPEGKRDSHAMPMNNLENYSGLEKENQPVIDRNQNKHQRKSSVTKRSVNSTSLLTKNEIEHGNSGPTASIRTEVERMESEPMCFIFRGHRLQRNEFRQVIKRLKGRCCRDSHQWSYQATHFISPEPLLRTEKLFAAAAAGKWILKTDFLTASSKVGKFLAEEPYEWHGMGLSEDGSVNLEAPRKWRILRQRTGHGALHGMRVVIYGDCVAPPLDTLKRVIKAGGGTVLATSPPFSRFLATGVDYAIVSQGMPSVDVWVQLFLKHEIPCVLADYLVDYVCKPGFPLERHVLYSTHIWAERSYSMLQKRAEELDYDLTSPNNRDNNADISCQVCGSRDRGDVMLICGNESGTVGCGIGTHIDCCDPPLEDVPVEDWFCPECSKSKKCSNPSVKKRKGVLSSQLNRKP